MRNIWFFKVYVSTFLISIIVLGSTAFVGYKCMAQMEKANELKNTIAEKYEYLPSENEGISFLLICENEMDNSHNFYALIDYSPAEKSITSAVIPWQLTQTVGVKKRSLDGFAEKGTSRDVLTAVNTSLGLSVPKYIAISESVLADCADIAGGVDFNVDKDICYGSDEKYVAIRAGEQSLSGDMLVGVLNNPENYRNRIKGYDLQSRLFGKLISEGFWGLTSDGFKNVFTTSINGAETNIIAEDYEYRKNSLDYSLNNEDFKFNSIPPDGEFDRIKDVFTPSEEYIAQIKSVFPVKSE